MSAVEVIDQERAEWEQWVFEDQGLSGSDRARVEEMRLDIESMSGEKRSAKRKLALKLVDVTRLLDGALEVDDSSALFIGSMEDDKSSHYSFEHAWYLLFPIDFRTSQRIVKLATRMPKENIERLVYPFAFSILEGPKRKFFDALVEYGRSYGLSVVGGQLFAGAQSGDPRAVKMYMEMMKVINDDGPRENLMRVEFEF